MSYFLPAYEAKRVIRKFPAEFSQCARGCEHRVVFWNYGDATVSKKIRFPHIGHWQRSRTNVKKQPVSRRWFLQLTGEIVQNIVEAFCAVVRARRLTETDSKQNDQEQFHCDQNSGGPTAQRAETTTRDDEVAMPHFCGSAASVIVSTLCQSGTEPAADVLF